MPPSGASHPLHGDTGHQDHGVVHPPDHYWIKPEALRRPSALLDMAVPAGV